LVSLDRLSSQNRVRAIGDGGAGRRLTNTE